MTYNLEQIQSAARQLALLHTPYARGKQPNYLKNDIDIHMEQIRSAVQALQNSDAACLQPADEWLLDNSEFLEEQVEELQDIVEDKKFESLYMEKRSRRLRIHDVCEHYLKAADGVWNEQTFTAFIEAYQEVHILSIHEIWSLAIVLRAAFIDQIAEVVLLVRERREACINVDKMLAQIEPENLTSTLLKEKLEQFGQEMPLSGPWLVHLITHLREWTGDFDAVRHWLHCQYDQGTNDLNQVMTFEHQLQASYQLRAGNLITSMRAMERMDWQSLFEHLCLPDRTYRRRDNDYKLLDAGSRNNVLARTAELAARFKVPENLIAEQVGQLVEKALSVSGTATDKLEDKAGRSDISAQHLPHLSRSTSIAYYLYEIKGIKQLFAALRACSKPNKAVKQLFASHASGTYFMSTVGLLIVLTGATVYMLLAGSDTGWIGYAAAVLAAVWPVSEWVLASVHYGIEKLCRPKPLLRLDFSGEIPKEASTMVVIPAIWSSASEIHELADQLEIHYLANRKANLHFALLGDFVDSSEEEKPEDLPLLHAGKERIERLNKLYNGEGATFHFLQRKRIWNENERVFMGWERKRGKLGEFVQLLKGSTDTSYFVKVGDADIYGLIKYIITLDADTQLPLNTAERMVATMHLPYNRPRLNAAGTRVIEGYGVLQPRIGISHVSALKSRLSFLSAEPGVDPYVFAASDPYQDALSEAIFTGKGIFDVDAFHQILCDRIPDNRVLSHDLLEGGFLRAGLMCDVELVDDHPSTFIAYQKRMHRWVRGDWQLLCWLLPALKNRRGELVPVDLSFLTRWQMLDNLRRSLLPIAYFAVLTLALAVLPGQFWSWLLVISIAWLIPVAKQLPSVHYEKQWRRVQLSFFQMLVQFAALPFQAGMMLDAIGKSLYRLFISKRNLLEWTSSSHIERAKKGQQSLPIAFAGEGYILIAVFFLTSVIQPYLSIRILGFILSLLWAAAPLVAKYLDRSVFEEKEPLTETVKQRLNVLAHDIWKFYEDYAREEDHYLPPDNVQFEPDNGVARRTSPTNIGFLLTSIAAARFFEFIDTESLVDRMKRTIVTIEKLEKWHGHLYNWYDTATLAILPPAYVSAVDSGNFVASLMTARQAVLSIAKEQKKRCETAEEQQEKAAAKRILEQLGQLADRMETLIVRTDFRKLYDSKAKLFVLGYNGQANKLDTILYDLLASEARQTSFVAIALGQISSAHWSVLGRSIKEYNGNPYLLSWTGTMFEYMMPWLIMRTYPGTLWDSTYKAIVQRQVAYGKEKGVPFGISESGYYGFDYNMNYQYRAFGVPGLGFKRGLEQDLVISPYASIMALPYALEEGLQNLEQLESIGARGKYGFYEAVDYTASRMPVGSEFKIVESFMAHHQGMSLMTLANMLLPVTMIDYFHQDKRVQAAELLLTERIPPLSAVMKRELTVKSGKSAPEGRHSGPIRQFDIQGRLPKPEMNINSNGKFTTAVTANGSGYLHYKGMDLTRWREDPIVDPWGSYLYIREIGSNQIWSPSYAPCEADHQSYKVQFYQEKTAFHSQSGTLASMLEIHVSPELNAEIRELKLINTGREAVACEVTTFVELAMAHHEADKAHPAFSRLFVQTQFDAGAETILARKRPRQMSDEPFWAFHKLYVNDVEDTGLPEFETDRAYFIGRGGTLRKPYGIEGKLIGKIGSVADPAFVMRRKVTIEAGKTVQLTAITGAASSRDEAIEMANRLSDRQQVLRSKQLAWTFSQIELAHLHVQRQDIALYQQMGSRIRYRTLQSEEQKQATALLQLGQSALWTFGVSGDRPILLVRATHTSQIPFLTRVLTGCMYLWKNGLHFDAVIWNETNESYEQQIHSDIHRFMEIHQGGMDGANGHVRLISAEGVDESIKHLFWATASLVLQADGASLKLQLNTGITELWQNCDEPMTLATDTRQEEELTEALTTDHWEKGKQASKEQRNEQAASGLAFQSVAESSLSGNSSGSTKLDVDHTEVTCSAVTAPQEKLLFFNGYGGFSEDGSRYIIEMNGSNRLPAPWINVLSNPNFGCFVSERFTGYSWQGNSRECKLTPWSNDPALDPPGELCFIKDEDSMRYWQPAAASHMRVTHSQGYSQFDSENIGITAQTRVFVPLEDPLKIINIKLKNETAHARNLSVTYYAEWVLGVNREGLASMIVSSADYDSGTLIARNSYQETFRDAHAFLTFAGEHIEDISWTANRESFVGGNGSASNPAALKEERLSGEEGIFANSCGAVQMKLRLEAGEEKEAVIVLGCTDSEAAAIELVGKYREPGICNKELESVLNYWEQIRSTITVTTPSKQMNVMLNHWLMYQTIACRLWARTAFYQAGGAFGYRDQLQDSLAMLHFEPERTKSQILLHAAHQYEEGDVQHWWHEETERGIRTKFSDDLLWLPYAVLRYIEQTGDSSILHEQVSYLTSTPLSSDEHERYEETIVSSEVSSVAEHCFRALDRSLKTGEHGLPLIGIGDWNDGMSLIGAEGRGESVWLGWFLGNLLQPFSEIAKQLDEQKRSQNYSEAYGKLIESMEEHGWDGKWYRRAFTDSGHWLGTEQNKECRIDSIAQSWSVISGMARQERAEQAMRSFDQELVESELMLARILTPPFDTTDPSPGYIQGYPPGIRENGAQYTHGVIWSIVAWSKLGQGAKSFELFDMLNPVNHATTLTEAQTYAGEPYVMAADVYAEDPHKGHAGWTWYTGASGWMYQAGVEWIIGLRKQGDKLLLRPCIPPEWEEYSVEYKYGATVYKINVSNPNKKSTGIQQATMNGQKLVLTGEGSSYDTAIIELRHEQTGKAEYSERTKQIEQMAKAVKSERTKRAEQSAQTVEEIDILM